MIPFNSIEFHLVDCVIKGMQTNETISQPILLSSVNNNPKTISIQQDTWYDHVAILSTRGFANIYHNAEWIMNFIHFAASSSVLQLVMVKIVLNSSLMHSLL